MSSEQHDDDVAARFTVILTKGAKEAMDQITKQHKISQAEVLDAVLTKLDRQQWAATFDEVRAKKVQAREQKRKAAQLLANLPPDELERLAALAARSAT